MHVVHETTVGGSSIIWVFPLAIADSPQDLPGIEPGPLGWYTSTTTGLKEVRRYDKKIRKFYLFPY